MQEMMCLSCPPNFCRGSLWPSQVVGFRASSYEPGNQAGSVTGMNVVVCSYGKFQLGTGLKFMKQNQNGAT